MTALEWAKPVITEKSGTGGSYGEGDCNDTGDAAVFFALTL